MERIFLSLFGPEGLWNGWGTDLSFQTPPHSVHMILSTVVIGRGGTVLEE